MKVFFFPNLRSKRMMINPLANDKITKSKKRRHIMASLKTPSLWINVEYEIDSSISQ